MALLYQTTGIILGWKHHNEADRWYSVLTEEYGKIEFRARGAQKPLAKLAPHLEMMAEIDLMLVNGRQYEIIAGVERKRAFSGLYQDFTRLLLAKSSLYLTDISTKQHQEDDGLYGFLCEWLGFLETIPTITEERSAYLLAVFALRVLAVTGYEPNARFCLGCREVLAKDILYWQALKGGVACKKCVMNVQNEFSSNRSIKIETLQIIRHAQSASFNDQLRLFLPGKLLNEFHEAIESLLVSHFPVVTPNTLRDSCVLSTIAKIPNSANIKQVYYDEITI